MRRRFLHRDVNGRVIVLGCELELYKESWDYKWLKRYRKLKKKVDDECIV